MAELYECSIGDLLPDYGDFRDQDSAHAARQQLGLVISDGGPAQPAAVAPDVTALADRLEEMDVHDIARLGAAWVQQLDRSIDRRGLLLKLSAGLTLAAAAPLVAGVEGGSVQAAVSSPEKDRLTGIWHSRYLYRSSGRAGEFEGEHYVVLRPQGGRLIGQSLPHSLGSRLRLDLSVDGSVATGTWSEDTSPTGYYKGAVYHGTMQLLVDPMARMMSGKWLGFGKNFKVNTGQWELTWIEGSVSNRAMRAYHLKV